MHRREQRRSPWVLCLPLGGDQTPRGGAVQQDLRDRQGGSHTYLQSFRGPLAKDHMEEVVKHVSVFYHLIKSFTSSLFQNTLLCGRTTRRWENHCWGICDRGYTQCLHSGGQTCFLYLSLCLSDTVYTQGERKWKQSTITIDGVRRSDDGLYECQAENEGGMFYKSGHIQVGFVLWR